LLSQLSKSNLLLKLLLAKRIKLTLECLAPLVLVLKTVNLMLQNKLRNVRLLQSHSSLTLSRRKLLLVETQLKLFKHLSKTMTSAL